MLQLLTALAFLASTPVAETPHGDDRWTLVFEDEFDGDNRPLDDWNTFGDATSQDKGKKGRGLLLSAPGGRRDPAFAGAVTRLGGGAVRDERITIGISWRDMSKKPSDASLALKLEYRDVNGGTLKIDEIQAPLAEGRRGWNETTVTGVVPANAKTIDAAVVLVPGQRKSLSQVLIDELTATRTAPPLDLVGGGGFEATDGGAPGWSSFNNAVAADDAAHGRILKTWGPYNEPYGGSGVQQTVTLPGIRAGTKIQASVQAMTAGSDSIAATDNFPVLRLECLSNEGKTLAHIERRPFDPEKGRVPVDQWVDSTVELAAPEGTRSAKMILVFIQPTTKPGSVFFRRPEMKVAGMKGPILQNPDFRAGDSMVPGWSSIGDVALESTEQHSGANAVRLVQRDGQETSVTRTLEGWTPGSTVSIDGWALATYLGPNIAPGIEFEIVQTDARGKKVTSKSRVVNPRTPMTWTSLAGDRPFDVKIAPRASKVEVVARATGGGELLLDDVTVYETGRTLAGPIAVPIRNPGFQGMRPDPKSWEVADGAWSHNGELQYYSPDSITLDRGRMLITAEKRKVGDRKYSSGHIRVTPRLEQTYGRWEIRAKLPNSQGMWPAIWLLPKDGSWPPEIDIIELVGKEPNRVHHSYHWGPLRDGLAPWDLGQTSTDHFDDADYADTWHDFAMEWTPESIVWYVDGKEAHRFGNTPEERSKIPNKPMYLIMNAAIGGFWPGPPGAATKWPSTMEIDRVRIYEYDGATG